MTSSPDVFKLGFQPFTPLDGLLWKLSQYPYS